MKKKKARASVERRNEPFDRYSYYRRAVQSPDVDVLFLRDVFKEIRGKEPVSLREDFCGTFAISCEWARLSPKFRSYGVDIDAEPIAYGLAHNLLELKPTERERVIVQQANVLSPELPNTDIIAAMNFSYYVFKSRQLMRTYFENAYKTLNRGGLFVVDCFGGPACEGPSVEETKHRGFSYIWEQMSFDPLTNEALFQIHFKVKEKGGRVRKHLNAFTYDWRMWSIPELRDIMADAGFEKTRIYWEGTSRSGEGDGIFTEVIKGEECEAWVAYIVAEK